MKFFEQLKITQKQIGIRNTSLYLIDRMMRSVSGDRIRLVKYLLFSQPVTDKQFLPANRGNSIMIHQLKYDDKKIHTLPRDINILKTRFNSGSVCLAAYKNNEFIGFLWLNFGDYAEDEVRCHFSPSPAEQTVWDFDVHIEQKHRIGFAFLRLWDETNKFLKNRGHRWTTSRISAFKPLSIQSHTRLGGKCIGSVTFLCLGNTQIMASTLPPYLHISFNTQSIPKIKVKGPS